MRERYRETRTFDFLERFMVLAVAAASGVLGALLVMASGALKG
jgi:hypothetical protein